MANELYAGCRIDLKGMSCHRSVESFRLGAAMAIKIFHWMLPSFTGVAGVLLGGWVSGGFTPTPTSYREISSMPEVKGHAMKAPATPVGGRPTEEEGVREEEARRLWESGGLEPTLEALTAYARVNPARALDLAMSLKGENAWELVMKLVQTLPVTAGGIAMDVLLRHPEYCKACPPQHAVFYLCAKGDPERAWREAHAPGVKFTSNALDAIASACGETNPRKAMELAGRLTKMRDQVKFTRDVLRGWAERDGRDLVAWLGTQEDAESYLLQVPWGKMQFETQEDFLAMVRLVPTGVLDGTLGEGHFFGMAKEGSWAMRLDWLQGVTDAEPRRALFAGAARALIDADPEQALALLPEITDVRLRQRIMSATAAYRTAVSPEQGLAYADSLPDETARQLARESVLNTWAENDPAAAARHMLATGMPMDDSSMAARQQIGSKWAQLDPQAAVSYALAHEPQSAEAFAGGALLGSAMRQWVQRDPYAASVWVNELPTGTHRDQAAAALASASLYREPDGAMAWAANIADPVLRGLIVKHSFETWLNLDAGRARGWLEQQVTLDAATRQVLAAAMESMAAKANATGGTSRRWINAQNIIVVY